MYVFALDFDGVLCDSANETAHAGWKACCVQWPDIFNSKIKNKTIDDFYAVRPALKTGYECMILLYLLERGNKAGKILENYVSLKKSFFKETGVSVEDLKEAFGNVRDRWIKSDFNSWLKVNTFYPGVIEAVKNCPYPVYIVTTKQKRFATALCKYAGLDLPEANIFGLENGEKSASLKQIQSENTGKAILFVEDRLDNLLEVKVEAAKLHKFYADWGYGTEDDHNTAQENSQITVVGLSDFPQFMKTPADFLL